MHNKKDSRYSVIMRVLDIIFNICFLVEGYTRRKERDRKQQKLDVTF